MDAKACFEQGRLAEAIQAQTQAVKSSPLNGGLRTFLFELLAFAGELDRADKQLDVIGHDNTQTAWGASVYQNLLAAERTRRQAFTTGTKPETFLDPPEFLAKRFAALASLAQGRVDAAVELLAHSDAAAPAVRGTVNGQGVEGLRDADDLLAPVLEAMVLRDYVWIPWSQIRELEVEPPARPRDLIWAPARLTLEDGVQRHAYLPVLYPDSHKAADDALRLGRLTDWIVPDTGPVRGVGQHLLTAGEFDLGLLELRQFQADS